MVKTQHFLQYPFLIFEQIYMRKFCSSSVSVFLAGLPDIEIMDSVLDHSIENTIIIQRKNFQRFFSHFTDWFFMEVRAKIFSGVFQKFHFVLNSAPIMIEHKILVCHFLHVSVVALVEASLKKDAVVFLQS